MKPLGCVHITASVSTSFLRLWGTTSVTHPGTRCFYLVVVRTAVSALASPRASSVQCPFRGPGPVSLGGKQVCHLYGVTSGESFGLNTTTQLVWESGSFRARSESSDPFLRRQITGLVPVDFLCGKGIFHDFFRALIASNRSRKDVAQPQSMAEGRNQAPRLSLLPDPDRRCQRALLQCSEALSPQLPLPACTMGVPPV